MTYDINWLVNPAAIVLSPQRSPNEKGHQRIVNKPGKIIATEARITTQYRQRGTKTDEQTTGPPGQRRARAEGLGRPRGVSQGSGSGSGGPGHGPGPGQRNGNNTSLNAGNQVQNQHQSAANVGATSVYPEPTSLDPHQHTNLSLERVTSRPTSCLQNGRLPTAPNHQITKQPSSPTISRVLAVALYATKHATYLQEMAIKYRQLGANNDPNDNWHKYFELGRQKFLRDLSKSPEKRDDAVLPTVAWPVPGLRSTRPATGSSSIPAPPHTQQLVLFHPAIPRHISPVSHMPPGEDGHKSQLDLSSPVLKNNTSVNNSNNTSHMRPELNPPSLSIL
ncbi:hypothetical protein QBC45DRAFT_441888 [Copromyces sp. CBS 386.78]|nr:hypothetical protein QBC45DRAFT_441888 [Copromyces sp. CBS 386.78]